MATAPSSGVKLKSTDIPGLSRLAVDAVKGVCNIAEALHLAITSLSGVTGPPTGKHTRGITGLVYRNIRGVTDRVGDSIESLMEKLNLSLATAETSPGRESLLAALNGVLGDHLVERENPLAIKMQIRHQGQPWTPDALSDAIRSANGRVVLLVHGLCMNDLQWNRLGHDHGAALAADHGLLPLYLHYNSGRHISENGRDLAELMETLLDVPELRSISILAHSMGGLVSRSAYHYGKEAGMQWPERLEKIVFLGTPHHGAPLEKGGNWIDSLLDVSPYSAPFSRLGKIRSSGITDLRYGNLHDEDWQGRDRFAPSGDQRTPRPLPEGVAVYAVAATTTARPSIHGDQIGDGLVPLHSALGHDEIGSYNLAIPQTHQRVVRNINHLDLLSDAAVYDAINEWFSP